MPTQSLPLRRGERERLKITYDADLSNLYVYLDGELISSIDDKNLVKAGVTVNLPDGTVIGLSSPPGWKLQVLINGLPALPAVLDPARQISNSAMWTMIVGALYLFNGIISKSNSVYGDVGKMISVALGILFVVCAYFVTRRSKLALGIAVGIYGVETILLLVSMLSSNGIAWWPILSHIVFLGAMSLGFKAIDNANNYDYLAAIPTSMKATSKFSSALNGEPLYQEKAE